MSKDLLHSLCISFPERFAAMSSFLVNIIPGLVVTLGTWPCISKSFCRLWMSTDWVNLSLHSLLHLCIPSLCIQWLPSLDCCMCIWILLLSLASHFDHFSTSKNHIVIKSTCPYNLLLFASLLEVHALVSDTPLVTNFLMCKAFLVPISYLSLLKPINSIFQ